MLAASVLSTSAFSQEPIALLDPAKPAGGWAFDNGPEFPGARGNLELAAERFRDQPVLSLHGDFAEGGNYVQASIVLPKNKLKTLSFWVNVPAGSERLPIRLMDSEQQVHQINLKISEKGGWQHIVFPVAEFFKRMGTTSSLDMVVRYEKWDGAKDREKHQKQVVSVPNLAILASRAMGTTKGTILISNVLFHPSTEKTASVSKTIELDEMLQEGEIDWGFNLGQEFAGAKGGLELVRDQPVAGRNAMRLHADFKGGGAYVGVRKSFSQLDVAAMKAIHLKMRSETTGSFALRLVDGTGQCHQRKDLSFTADGKWHDVVLVPTEIAGGEHWGGANDGEWHDPVRLIELMLNTRSHEGKTPDLYITDIQADVVVEASVKASTFAEHFKSDEMLKSEWKTAGNVRVEGPGHGETNNALVLQRPLDSLQTETWTTSQSFGVAPGMWQVQYAWKSKLHSPDNSYHASIALEVFDDAGQPLETIPVGIGYGQNDWQSVAKSIELPRGSSKARFRVQLQKTYGTFWLDELSAARLSTQPIERRIERVLVATEALGNLFVPGEDVAVQVTVEAVKPLPESQQIVRYDVRDYWGADQFMPRETSLEKAPRKNNRFVYTAQIAIPNDLLEVGKYYEFHAAIPQKTGEPVREYTGVAILPTAVAKKYSPEQVPFTIRNWDSRIPIYFRLADRLGLRLMGVWGGWSSKPPYKPHCPGIDLCRELDAKWITGTPAAQIERKGFADYSEESLRQGMKNFLDKYAGSGMAMIAMGNEPHGTGDKVLENVRAYKAIYETVKAFDPNIHVIGTSVEPNEEYFKAGYQNYLDSYDFHIYKHYTNVRRTIHEYRALMEKYSAVKPIHSTELGLNSQGQTRHAVALEMIKKCTVFFAEGGETVSWFTIQYPDPKGKARGQAGDAHCVFDCKYNLYNPRLDAITYYNMVNGICDKKFVEEKHYANGAQAYLFRNRQGDCLQVLWLDDTRADVFVPLPARRDVELIRIDGSHAKLQSINGGITLDLSNEPVLLLYEDERQTLASELGEAAFALATPPAVVDVGGTTTFTLVGKNLTAPALRLACPPLWNTSLQQAGDDCVEVAVRPPAATTAREARIYAQLLAAGKVIGELTIPVRVSVMGPVGSEQDTGE